MSEWFSEVCGASVLHEGHYQRRGKNHVVLDLRTNAKAKAILEHRVTEPANLPRLAPELVLCLLPCAATRFAMPNVNTAAKAMNKV